LALSLIYVVDLLTPAGSLGTAAIIPVLAAAWVLSGRLAVLVTLFALASRLLEGQHSAVPTLESLTDVLTILLVAGVGRVAAVYVTATQEAAARADLMARIAQIATSAESLKQILDRILREMAREGLRGGLVGLILLSPLLLGLAIAVRLESPGPALHSLFEAIGADAIATANGWDRRLARALRAFERPTRLTHPLVLAELAAKATFGVTELERFADCSSIWFLERLIDPKSIDARVDARMRGQVAHQALYKFYSGLPKELGADRVEQDRVEDALAFLRKCLDDAVQGVRVELTDLERRELRHGLWRDLEAFVREEAVADMPLVPRRFEVLFGSERSAPELQRGLELAEGITLSGKIDRIDVDPFSARGIVQDYKAGKYAHSAQQIESEKRLQIPLYMLVLRDLVGVEPLGGLYRPLSGERKARGLLRAEAREDGIPGFAKNDYLAEEEFWGKVEGARELAVGIVERIRTGDVQHDPKGGDCPTWCELASMCRIKRA